MITDIIAILKFNDETFILKSEGQLLDKDTKQDIEFIIKNDLRGKTKDIDEVIEFIKNKLEIKLEFSKID